MAEAFETTVTPTFPTLLHALPKLNSPRYKHLKAILDSNLDGPTAQTPTRKKPDGGPGSGPKGHVRGADYYRD